MKAARFHQHGGPEVLRYEDAPEPKPNPGEVLVRVKACALNHHDIWVRRSEEHTSELQSQSNLVCRLLLEKKKTASAEQSTSSICWPSSLAIRRRQTSPLWVRCHTVRPPSSGTAGSPLPTRFSIDVSTTPRTCT